MKESADNLTQEARRNLSIFNKCLPAKIRFQEIVNEIGVTADLACMDIGASNGSISHFLRKHGGCWDSVVTNEKSRSAVGKIVPDRLHLMEDGRLPFEKHSFDVVVVLDLLEVTQSDNSFIEECHRVLKPDGRLLISVARTKSMSFVNVLRKWLGLTCGRDGEMYVGYTEAELFTLLKHGFDVHSMRTYIRFFLEFADSFVRFFAMGISSDPDDQRRVYRENRLYTIAVAFYWICYQLDFLIFFSKGHHLLACAKRRAWRSRNAPILNDGRSISEAVLAPLK